MSGSMLNTLYILHNNHEKEIIILISQKRGSNLLMAI